MLDLHHIFAVQKRALFFACTLRIRLGIYPYQTVLRASQSVHSLVRIILDSSSAYGEV